MFSFSEKNKTDRIDSKEYTLDLFDTGDENTTFFSSFTYFDNFFRYILCRRDKDNYPITEQSEGELQRQYNDHAYRDVQRMAEELLEKQKLILDAICLKCT